MHLLVAPEDTKAGSERQIPLNPDLVRIYQQFIASDHRPECDTSYPPGLLLLIFKSQNRGLQIYQKHNRQCAIQFINYVIEEFPFRINTIRTDRGHEFQAKFHWHVEDQGMKHIYFKPRSPQLNGKVERSHQTDQQEFYQLLTYTDDVDLKRKLEACEQFYNLDRPHGAFAGKTPHEVLRSLLN